ncbi:MAG: hypothetical protein EOL98_15935, partial [Negativicutes bacterium]|nr:hypothetical protein [Negativicutes bacterium]
MNQDFFAYEYPLVQLFPYGDDILVYDAKPHFAFIISADEMQVLIDFLSEKTAAEIFNANYKPVIDAAKKQLLLTKFQALKKSGVFSRGPAGEISPVDCVALAKQIKYYDENILLRKFCLEVTQNCNYACRYCKRTIAAAKGQASQLDMTEDIAYQGLNYYFQKYTAFFQKLAPAKKQLLLETVPPTLSWYGGEPFLNFDLIKKSAAYFQSLP